MEYLGIVITGTSGSGKSTVAKKVCEKYTEDFKVVQAVTTRGERDDDQENAYEYISVQDFNVLDQNEKLLVKAEYRGQKYGIKRDAVKSVLDKKKIPILIITPKSAKTLMMNVVEGRGPYFLTVFLDASDDDLYSRVHPQGGQTRDGEKNQRTEDRRYIEDCLYVLNNGNHMRVDDIAELVCSLWSYRRVGGLLPKRMIRSMIKSGMLLKVADLDKVSGASYDLSLGDQYWQDGEKRTLDSDNPFVNLRPGDYAIVSSKEIACFPRDVAGKFDLTVSLFCQGVILSNGPQVDPGFSGRLFCLLFNTSNNTISLKRGEHYATLEFVKLVEPTDSYMGRYQGKDDIIDYLPKPSEPSVICKLKEDVEIIKSTKWWEKTLPIIISIVALVVAVIVPIILFLMQNNKDN